MEHTRASIRNTVEELRGKVGDTVDWRQYVNWRPGASLTVALGLGLVLGRARGGRVRRSHHEEPDGRAAEPHGDSGFPRAASRRARLADEPAEPILGDARRVVGESVSRLGSRAEGILNRLVDELTDAVETMLIPALAARVRDFLDLESRRSRSSPGGGDVGRLGFVEEQAREREPGRRWDQPVHEEPGGVYPGTPAGGLAAQSP
jgi:hypothetical protein